MAKFTPGTHNFVQLNRIQVDDAGNLGMLITTADDDPVHGWSTFNGPALDGLAILDQYLKTMTSCNLILTIGEDDVCTKIQLYWNAQLKAG